MPVVNNIIRVGLKVIIGILVFIILLAIMELIYLFKGEVKSTAPKEIKKTYQLQEKAYKGRNVFVLSSKNGERSDLVIMYIHGGSYVGELTDQHWNFMRKLVDDTGAIVIAPDYPLTPKYNYEDVKSMMEPLYQEVIQKVDPEHLVVMGDSAGGGLALGLMETLGEKSIAQPSQLILLSPWLDVTMENEEINEVEKVDPVLNKMALKIAGENYSGKEGKENYFANPVYGPLDKLRNVTIFTGTYDILNPDAKKIEKRAKEENADIQLIEKEKAYHVWMLDIDDENNMEAKQTYQQIIELLKKD